MGKLVTGSQSEEQARSVAHADRSRGLSLTITALLSAGIGLVVGLSVADGDVGQPPAIEMAREIGMALPVAQQPAFADGVITRAEVEGALERLTECAESQGVTGFAADLADEGTDFHMEYSGGVNDIQLCRWEHFDATYRVWSQQERSSP